jgi:hypothetical protein
MNHVGFRSVFRGRGILLEDAIDTAMQMWSPRPLCNSFDTLTPRE